MTSISYTLVFKPMRKYANPTITNAIGHLRHSTLYRLELYATGFQNSEADQIMRTTPSKMLRSTFEERF